MFEYKYKYNTLLYALYMMCVVVLPPILTESEVEASAAKGESSCAFFTADMREWTSAWVDPADCMSYHPRGTPEDEAIA